MAGDWVKLEHATAEKPEVLRLADLLGVTTDDALGKVMRFWIWLDRNARNGLVTHMYAKSLETIMHCPGFCAAMNDVGWLNVDEKTGLISIPNHERHNGTSAKSRALTRDRVKRSRNAPSNASVTASALPEKRREDKRSKDLRLPIGTAVDKSASGQDPLLKEAAKRNPMRTDETLEEYGNRLKAALKTIA